MIQTIILIENGKYPFGEIKPHKKVIKAQQICTYNSIQQLRDKKIKIQQLFCIGNDKKSQKSLNPTQQYINIVKLLKIYQQDLNLHFIYQYIPYSLDQYIEQKLIPQDGLWKSQLIQMNSKLFFKKVCHQLSNYLYIKATIINFLLLNHIKTDFHYQLFGMDEQHNLKYYIDPSYIVINNCGFQSYSAVNNCEFQSLQKALAQLSKFYDIKKQQILSKLQFGFKKLKQKNKNVPNFIIKGNQLVFCKIQDQKVNDSPKYSQIHTDSSYTQRCQSMVGQPIVQQEVPSIRRTHGNLFHKLNKIQQQKANCQKNNKLQQNLNKIQLLKKRSKRLTQQAYSSNMTNSQNLPFSREFDKQPLERNNLGPKQKSNFINYKDKQQEDSELWRSSQIPSTLRQTHLPQGSKSQNRFGMNFENKRSKSNRNHKSSFQFKPNKKSQKQWFNPNKSFDKTFDDDCQQKSFNQQSKSIRIQLEQTMTKNKVRKNSYKVKILTCQQMQVDQENVQQFVFNAMNKNFSHKDQENHEDTKDPYDNDYQNQSQYESTRSKKSQFSDQYQNLFNENVKPRTQKRDLYQKYSQSPTKPHFIDKQKQVQQVIQQVQRQKSGRKNILGRYYQQLQREQKPLKNQKLQQKIKLAKQKAQNVLNKYMKNKKFSHNSNSKLGF